MKHLNIIMIFVFLLITIYSCKKDSNKNITEFKGVALSYDSGMPLSNVLIKIERNDGVSNNEIIGVITDTVRTNSKGEYSFLAIDNAKDWYYVNAILKDHIILYNSIIICKKTKQKEENKDTIKLGVCTYLKLNLLNNRTNDYDSLYISIKGESIIENNSVNEIAPRVFRLYPQYKDTVLIESLPYKYFHHLTVTWKVVDCANSIDNVHNINTIPKITSELEIEF